MYIERKVQFYVIFFLNSIINERFLSLYKWGGTYLDMDVIMMKSLKDVEPNYVVEQTQNFIGAGLMNFGHTEIGSEVAEACMQ